MNGQPAANLLAFNFRRGGIVDGFFKNLTWLSAFIVFAMVIAILVSLWLGALPALHKFGLGFLTSTAWDPVTEDFGALPAIFGTLVTSAIAMLIGVPVSFGIAVFIT